MDKGLLQGSDPRRISSNIATLKSRGVSESKAVGMAHAHAKKARKDELSVAPVVAPSLSLDEIV